MKVELTKDQVNILLQVLQKATINIGQAYEIQKLMKAIQTPVIEERTVKAIKKK